MGYSFGKLNVLFTDYIAGSENVLVFQKENTHHTGELLLQYTISERFPLQISVATLVTGNDFKVKRYTNEKGAVLSTKNNYSTYLELMFPVSIQTNTISFVLGGITHESNFYGFRERGIINSGISFSKEIALTNNFSLPVSFAVTLNPKSEHLFGVFKISL
ncbi:MAG: hypothetical protein HC906_17220 [Bacteroidales bacterium]|nr:hypothetical protein [Bacteroidales bacterium]